MKKYFLTLDGKTVGPYSANDLRAMNIKPSTPVWTTGASDWKSADTFPELQSLFNSDPFSVSNRPKQFNTPRPRSTSFSQFNFDPEPPARKPNLRVGMIIAVVLICIAAGAGYYIQKQKALREANAEAEELVLDSLTSVEQQDGEAEDTVAEVSPVVSNDVSMYTGDYDNLKGGIIRITESDGELKVDLKYNLGTGEKCSGEIKGTGIVLSESLVSMTTGDGCNLKLEFHSRYTVEVKESDDCKIDHGKHCLFDGVYYGQ